MSQKRVAVWNAGQGTCKSRVGTTSEVVISGNSVAGVGTVKWLVGANKDVGLDENLSTITGVDSVVDSAEVAVVEVASAESNGWCTGVNVEPVALFRQYEYLCTTMVQLTCCSG